MVLGSPSGGGGEEETTSPGGGGNAPTKTGMRSGKRTTIEILEKKKAERIGVPEGRKLENNPKRKTKSAYPGQWE